MASLKAADKTWWMLTTCRVAWDSLISTQSAFPHLPGSQYFHHNAASYNSNPILFSCKLKVNLESLSLIGAEWSASLSLSLNTSLCTGFAFHRDSQATIRVPRRYCSGELSSLMERKHYDFCDHHFSAIILKCGVYGFRVWWRGFLKLCSTQFFDTPGSVSNFLPEQT